MANQKGRSDYNFEAKLVLARYIREERERLGLIQTELAEELGVKVNRVVNLESSNYNDPNFLMLARIVASKRFLIAKDPSKPNDREPITLEDIYAILSGKLDPFTGKKIENGSN